MERAGLGRTIFYRHFDDLGDLLMRAGREAIEELYDGAARARRGPRRDRSRRHPRGDRAAGRGLQPPRAAAARGRRGGRRGSRLAAGQEAIRQRFDELVADALQQVRRRRRAASPTSTETARALNLLNESYLLDAFGREPRVTAEAAVATLTEIWAAVLGRAGDERRATGRGPGPARTAGRAAGASAAGQPGLGIRPGERLEVAAVHDAFATDAARPPRARRALRAAPRRSRSAAPSRPRSRAGSSASTRETLAVTASTPRLPGGAFWPGGIAAHANGDLHMVFGRWAHRLSPDLDVLASHRLPVPRPHNSFVVLDGGELVTKDCDAPAGPRALDGLGPRPRDAAAGGAAAAPARALDRAARVRRRERDRGRDRPSSSGCASTATPAGS